MARGDDVNRHYPPLTNEEQSDCASELVWRKRMLAFEKRQCLALEEIVALLKTQGGTLEQVREHFESWAVEEP